MDEDLPGSILRCYPRLVPDLRILKDRRLSKKRVNANSKKCEGLAVLQQKRKLKQAGNM